MSSVKTRLKKIEGTASPKMIGWLDATVDPDLVELNGTKETMTVAAFHERYPNGVLCRWEEVDDVDGKQNEEGTPQ